jgi:hypothetical protein
LTDLGRKQASLAGDYIRKYISKKFDRYYCSEYIRYRRPSTGIACFTPVLLALALTHSSTRLLVHRAMETASLLGLDGAQWFCDFYLRERDKGVRRPSYLRRRHTHAHTHTRTTAHTHFSFFSRVAVVVHHNSQLLGGVSDLQRKEEEHYRSVMAHQERGMSALPLVSCASCVLFAARAVPHTHRWIRTDAFYWAPPGGESIASSCLRVDRMLDILR